MKKKGRGKPQSPKSRPLTFQDDTERTKALIQEAREWITHGLQDDDPSNDGEGDDCPSPLRKGKWKEGGNRLERKRSKNAQGAFSNSVKSSPLGPVNLSPLQSKFDVRPQTSPQVVGSRVQGLSEGSMSQTLSPMLFKTQARPGTSGGVDMKQIFLQNTDMNFWKESFLVEEFNYRSFATLAERKLLEAEMATIGLEVPNTFRTAIACDILNKLSDVFVRFGPLLKRLAMEIFCSIYVHGADLQMDSMTSVDVMLHLGEPYFEVVEPYKRRLSKMEKRIAGYEDEQIFKQQELERHAHLVSFVIKHRNLSIKLLMFMEWKHYIRCLKGLYRRAQHIKLRIWWNGFRNRILRRKITNGLQLIGTLSGEVAKLKKDAETKSREIEAFESAAKERDELQAHIAKLNKENEELKNQVKRLSSKIDTMSDQKKEADHRNEELQREFAKQKTCADQFQIALQNSKKKVLKLAQKLEEAQLSAEALARQEDDVYEGENEYTSSFESGDVDDRDDKALSPLQQELEDGPLPLTVSVTSLSDEHHDDESPKSGRRQRDWVDSESPNHTPSHKSGRSSKKSARGSGSGSSRPGSMRSRRSSVSMKHAKRPRPRPRASGGSHDGDWDEDSLNGGAGKHRKEGLIHSMSSPVGYSAYDSLDASLKHDARHHSHHRRSSSVHKTGEARLRTIMEGKQINFNSENEASISVAWDVDHDSLNREGLLKDVMWIHFICHRMSQDGATTVQDTIKLVWKNKSDSKEQIPPSLDVTHYDCAPKSAGKFKFQMIATLVSGEAVVSKLSGICEFDGGDTLANVSSPINLPDKGKRNSYVGKDLRKEQRVSTSFRRRTATETSDISTSCRRRTATEASEPKWAERRARPEAKLKIGPGPAKKKTLSALFVLLGEFYSKKIAADLLDDKDGRERQDFMRFLYLSFKKKYGLVKLAQEHIRGVFQATEKYKSQSRRINMFASICGMDNPENFQEFYLHKRGDFYLELIGQLYPQNVIKDRLSHPDGQVFVLLEIAIAALDVVLPSSNANSEPPKSPAFGRIGGYRIAKERLKLNSQCREKLNRDVSNNGLKHQDGSVVVDIDIFLQLAIEAWTEQANRHKLTLVALFESFDKDKSGDLSMDEFISLMHYCSGGPEAVSTRTLELLFEKVNSLDGHDDDSMTISNSEFGTLAELCIFSHGMMNNKSDEDLTTILSKFLESHVDDEYHLQASHKAATMVQANMRGLLGRKEVHRKKSENDALNKIGSFLLAKVSSMRSIKMDHKNDSENS